MRVGLKARGLKFENAEVAFSFARDVFGTYFLPVVGLRNDTTRFYLFQHLNYITLNSILDCILRTLLSQS